MAGPLTSVRPVRWDPVQYGRFAAERGRPFDDLLGRVQIERAPRFVVDAGCGPGNLTATVLDRWPGADVVGFDASEEMIAAAQPLAGAHLRFEVADVGTWASDRPVDVMVSNAVLQWVPGHLALLPRLVSLLAPGGWLAIQVPGNYRDPSHTLIDELRGSARWCPLIGPDAAPHLSRWQDVAQPVDYLDVLAGCPTVDHVDVWETTYQHVLDGDDPVFEWMRGTGLRPTLAALADDDQRGEFADQYRAALRAAYPRRTFGTVLAFRRLFAVARRR